MTYHLLEITRTKRPSGVLAIEHDGIAVAAVLAKRAKSEDNHDAVPVDCQGGNQGYSDSSTLISSIGRDNSPWDHASFTNSCNNSCNFPS